jgi:hypothetical protein
MLPRHLVHENFAIMTDNLDVSASIVIQLANAATTAGIADFIGEQAVFVFGLAAFAGYDAPARRLFGLEGLGRNSHGPLPSRMSLCRIKPAPPEG